MAEKFTIDEAVQTGWSKFLENVGPMLLFVSLPVIVIPIVLGVPEFAIQIMNYKGENNTLTMIGLLVQLLMLPVKTCVQIVLAMGMIRISLKALDGVPFSFNDYMEAAPNFLNFLAAGFLYGAMLMVGFLCLILPGLAVFVVFHWYGYLILDKKMGPLQALGGSLTLCKDAYMDLAILWLVIFAINIVGFIALIIGLIPAQLLTLLILARVYRRLVENTPELAAA